MPSKKKPATAGMAALPSVPKELIEQLVGGATPMTADQINATTMATSNPHEVILGSCLPTVTPTSVHNAQLEYINKAEPR